jgi:serine phosphatase RsbU (regulator of sigma subunit)
LVYLEIILAWVATALSLILCTYNIFKKIRTAANIMLSAACLASTFLFGLIGVNLIDNFLIPPSLVQRFILSLLLMVAILIMGFFFIFPYKKKNRLAVAMAAGLPGFALCAITVVTDLIVPWTAEDQGAYLLTDGAVLYLAVITCYLLVTIIIIIIKASRLENRAHKNDLIYLVISLCIFFSTFLAVSLYLPFLADTGQFSTMSILITYSSILFILNYAAMDIAKKDMKVFFLTALNRTIIIAILTVPTILLIKYNTGEYLQEPVPPLGIAVFIFAYLFLVFKYLRPRIETLPHRKYQSMVSLIDQLFIKELSPESREGKTWEEILTALVDDIVENFKISHGHFYLFSRQEKKLSVIHNSVTAIPETEISLTSPLADLMGQFPAILYKPALYSDSRFDSFRDAVLQYMEHNHVEVIMPFLDQEGRIIGILSLGPLRNNRIYSKRLITVLELFRIQFQQHLANSLMLDQVRATQVIDHDQMVVNNVKKKIIPQTMHQGSRFRVSSLYINNSTYGGDYFDSVALGDERFILFISDSSYSGVDSAILSLEMYTVLHTPTKSFDAPDKILGTMNWVLSTSCFSSMHASAFCAVLSSSGDVSYANAAHNPMMVFSPVNDSFAACDTGGVPVGDDRMSKFNSKMIRLAPGSIGILYSDGLAAAVNDRGDVYGFSRVKELIKNGKGRSPSDLTRSIFEDYNQFINQKNQINDVSVIIFKYQ